MCISQNCTGRIYEGTGHFEPLPTNVDKTLGLVAHQYIILQIARELSPAQALKYD